MTTPPTIAGDPVTILRSIIAKRFEEWADGKPTDGMMLVWHPITEILDIDTGEEFLEARADVIAARDPPFRKARIITRFYAHIKGVEAPLVEAPPGVIRVRH